MAPVVFGLASEAQAADGLWEVLRREIAQRGSEMAEGYFSVMETGSGHGLLSLQLAKAFPRATVVSVEDSDAKTDWHHRRVAREGLWNNVVCNGSVGLTMTEKLYESPELLRFAIMRDDLLGLLAENPQDIASRHVGMFVSSGLTTFARVPTAAHASLAMALFPPHLRDEDETDALTLIPGSRLRGPTFTQSQAELTRLFSSSRHPTAAFQTFQTEFLRTAVRVPSGQTRVLAKPLRGPEGEPFPLLRLDVLNMTRKVHHHYDYKKDGHTRTYTMRVDVNITATAAAQSALGLRLLSRAGLSEGVLLGPADVEGQDEQPGGRQEHRYQLGLGQHVTADRVVTVRLQRDHDQLFIPYTSIHGVTLIAIMRLGLLPLLRDRAYGRFLALPLYEDMAPWNIVFRGPDLDYIDFDTKDVTFDALVPKVYQILSVLMNYKRSVQDFGKCTKDKAKTTYGFSHVSDCVESTAFRGPCNDPALPVPCGDGVCHSDYISCLRALHARREARDRGDAQVEEEGAGGEYRDPVEMLLAEALAMAGEDPGKELELGLADRGDANPYWRRRLR